MPVREFGICSEVRSESDVTVATELIRLAGVSLEPEITPSGHLLEVGDLSWDENRTTYTVWNGMAVDGTRHIAAVSVSSMRRFRKVPLGVTVYDLNQFTKKFIVENKITRNPFATLENESLGVPQIIDGQVHDHAECGNNGTHPIDWPNFILILAKAAVKSSEPS
jgi:hypothetical protein